MTPSVTDRNAVADRAPQSAARPQSSIEDELAVVAEELAAARALLTTFDPDSPPWAVEAELRRLELRWHVLAAHEPPPPSPGGGASRPMEQHVALRTRVTRSAVHTRAGRMQAD
jgi:hypothetical protein